MHSTDVKRWLDNVQETLFFGHAGTTVLPNTVMQQSLYDVYNACLEMAQRAVDRNDKQDCIRQLAHLAGLFDATYIFLFYHTGSPRDVEVATVFHTLGVEVDGIIKALVEE